MSAARPVRIRVSLTALIIPIMLTFCVLPMATMGGAWSVAYLPPIVIALVVLTSGTTARRSGLTVRWWRGWRRIAWQELEQIEFPGQRWAVAVTTDGGRVLLPGVRPVDLPRIVWASGSRLFLRRPVAHGPAAESDASEQSETSDAAPAPAGADTPAQSETLERIGTPARTDTPEQSETADAAAAPARADTPHEGAARETAEQSAAAGG